MSSVRQLSTDSWPQWKREAFDRIALGTPTETDFYWADPALLMADAGKPPDPWQASLLRDPAPRMLLMCSRQAGKSTATAALALLTALLRTSLVLLVSPTERQSRLLFQKLIGLYNTLGRPRKATHETGLTLLLANGSQIVALPGSEEGIRGYDAVNLLVIDEASRVPDALYFAVRPMLATSGGTLIALSTPFGKAGWFFDIWDDAAKLRTWKQYKITAYECPRINAEVLEEHRQSMPPRWFRQEYLCEFNDAVDAVFGMEVIKRASKIDDAYLPLVF